MQLLRRAFVLVFLLVLGCAAQQSSDPQLDRAIEHQLRSNFNLPPTVLIQVGPRKPSEFSNYDAVTVTLSLGDRKQPQDFLVSKDGKTLLRMTKMDLSKDPYAEMMSKINVAGRPVRGNKDAKVTVISFDDFQCPYCGQMHRELFNLFPAYADRVKVIYKDFPLPMHPWAIHAAVDANCLAAQNNDAYWAMADYVHDNQSLISQGQAARSDQEKQQASLKDQLAALDKIALNVGEQQKLDMPALQACIKAQADGAVKESLKEGNDLGITGTPTLFVNGEKVDGMLPPAVLRAVLDRALREAGQPTPPPTAPSAVAKPATAQPN